LVVFFPCLLCLFQPSRYDHIFLFLPTPTINIVCCAHFRVLPAKRPLPPPRDSPPAQLGIPPLLVCVQQLSRNSLPSRTSRIAHWSPEWHLPRKRLRTHDALAVSHSMPSALHDFLRHRPPRPWKIRLPESRPSLP